MKSPFVSELQPDRVITTSFLVHSKEIRQKKSGEMYLSLMLGDRTGELDAKMWDNVAEVLEEFERDDFVKVKGLIQIFHNRPQLTVHKLRRMDDSEIEFADYFPSSKRDPDVMWNELQEIIAGMENPHLRGLLNAIFADPEVARRYRRAPAAKQIHHAFLGGLIEHVLSVCGLAKAAAAHYPNIDRSLLLTGVILHDIGKIYELNYERGFSYSTKGQLLGHITIATMMVGDKARELPDFPPKLRVLVEHMILSHHGHLEFGSPKLPQFPEALLLHYLDDLDSKMECMRALLEGDRQVEGCFTSYSGALERTALKLDKYWEDEAAPAAPKPVQENATPAGPGPSPAAAAAPPPPPAPVRPDSPFADKLRLALKPAPAHQDN
jgi:3'-5' exoribonuclease